MSIHKSVGIEKKNLLDSSGSIAPVILYITTEKIFSIQTRNDLDDQRCHSYVQ